MTRRLQKQIGVTVNVRSALVEVITDVLSAGAEQTEWKPGRSHVWDVVAIEILTDPPAGAGAGTHQTTVIDSQGIKVTLGKSTFVAKLLYQYGYWFTANDTQYPATAAEQQELANKLIASYDAPIIFEYKNDTNVTQSNVRRYRILYKDSLI